MRASPRFLRALPWALLAAMLASLCVGSTSLGLTPLMGLLRGDEGARFILWELRLPRTLTAALAGAALGPAGLVMQTLFRNPLAGPYVMGVSAGATLGAAAAILAGAALPFLGGVSGLLAASCLGASLSMAVVAVASERIRSSMTLLILGLIFGQFAGAVVSLLTRFSEAERLQAFTAWTYGSFSGVAMGQILWLGVPVAVGLLLLHTRTLALDALLLGDEGARSLGIDVRVERRFLLGATALLAGAVTCFCGPIAFLGVAVPHVCRGLSGTAAHRVLFPMSVVVGAFLAVFCDMLTRLPGLPQALPVNAALAFLGAPFLAWIILRSRIWRTMT